MSFLFGRNKAKSPHELVRLSRECFATIERKKDSKSVDKAVEDLTKYVGDMKNILYGTGENEPNPDTVNDLINELFASDLLSAFIMDLDKLAFEARKDVAQVFNNILRRQIGTKFPLVDYITKNTFILERLALGYEDPDISLTCGLMLRECIRHETLAKMVLQSDNFTRFYGYVDMSNFDVASDAFATFKDLLTKHKAMCAEFIETNYDRVFEEYTALLKSENYVTRRQSLKLLGELLLDRANFKIMTRYISEPENLKLMMNLLRDKSKNIQYEAFHVFKIFVANPNKTQPIKDILLKNKEKLINYLSSFHNDREDEQFVEEKSLLLREISALEQEPEQGNGEGNEEQEEEEGASTE